MVAHIFPHTDCFLSSKVIGKTGLFSCRIRGGTIFQNRVRDPIVGVFEGTAAVHTGLGGAESRNEEDAAE
jgi:hypothetical protein